MKVKSYYAATVEDAIAQARQELGPEAVLLNSRKAPAEARHHGEYEVVLAAEAGAPFEQELVSAVSQPQPAPVVDKLAQEVADLRRQIERTAAMMRRAGTLTADIADRADSMRAFSSLVANEVDPELAHSIVAAARGGSAGTGDDAYGCAMTAEIANLFRVDPTLGFGDSPVKAVALVGGSGTGKTTTIVKLAVRLGIAQRRRVQLITTDTERVGSADQLRSFAAILGLPFEIADTPAALRDILEDGRRRDLVLIDTPGLQWHAEDDVAELARLLSSRPEIETQLVLSAASKPADLHCTIERAEPLRPKKLIFTRLDETGTFGGLLNVNVSSGLPVSFLSVGPTIPEDIEPARATDLCRLLIDGRNTKAARAAA